MGSILIIILLSLIIFLPSLGGGFVNWDDNQLLENQAWRGWGWRNVFWWFTSFTGADFKPLVWASYGIDYAFWELNPAGYHLGNILLHILNSLLLYFLLLRLIRRKSIRAAVFATLFFSLHPLRVESVAWITERKDVLFSFFYLLSILFYVNFVSPRNSKFSRNLRGGPVFRLNYFASLICAVLSCLSKPMAVSLPFVILLLDFYPLRRFVRNPGRVILEKVPYFIPVLIVSLLAAGAQSKSGILLHLSDVGLGLRLFLASRACFFYLLKTVYPVGLQPFYPWGEISPVYLNIGALSGVLVVTGALLFLRRKNGITWPLIVWSLYLITLAPVSGIFPTGRIWLADRFSYLPALAISAALYCGFAKMKTRFAHYFRPLSWAVLFILSLLTLAQQRIWKDSITLWEAVLSDQPDSPTAYDHMGSALFHRGKYVLAARYHFQALRRSPGDPDIHYNLAQALAAQDQLKTAEFYYRQALEIKPDHLRALINLGNVLVRQDRLEEALACFTKVIRFDRGQAGAHFNSGVVLFRQGKYDEAIEYFTRTLELSPDFQSARPYLERAKEKASNL